MQASILFGNGLDLGYGLKTSYSNFYDYLIHLEDQDEKLGKNLIFQKLKEDYDTDRLEYWKDYEVKLGALTQDFDDIEKFDEDKMEIDLYLEKFLSDENSKLNSIDIKSKDLLNKIIPLIGQCQREEDQVILQKLLDNQGSGHIYLKPVSFNYTDTVNKIFDIKEPNVINAHILNIPTSGYNMYLNKPFYLHGTLGDDMVIGINDANQILNSKWCENEEACDVLLKTRLLSQSGQQHMKKYKEIINSSSLICCYGLSIGETDKKYWIEIKQRLLKGDCLLLIYVHDNSLPFNHIRSKTKLRDKYKESFYINSECTDEERELLKNKIIIEVNHDIFSIEYANL